MMHIALGVFATLTVLFGLRLARRRMWACHGGPHHHRHGCHGGHRRRYGLLGRIEHELDLDETQSEMLREAFGEVKSEARATGEHLRGTMRDLADVLIEDELDDTRLGEIWASQDEAVRKLREKFQGELLKLHTTLKPEQRKRLAQLITLGPRAAFQC